jgi:hypothetical protein
LPASTVSFGAGFCPVVNLVRPVIAASPGE